MKKTVVVLILLVLLLTAFSSVAYAAGHTIPDAHGGGRAFGAAVAEAAQWDTAWLVEHVGGGGYEYIP